jgi:tRNA(Ile)-lysidine synthase
MLAPGAQVVAAVSGGPDSVCLLEVLASLVARLGITLAGVAHFNHKLRGKDSDDDEMSVAALAARHDLPFHRTESGGFHGNLEQEARRARLRFFKGLIREGKADRIALGHTRDDQAETVLFRLMRGSGLGGLAGILPVTREGLIRPLIDVSRAEVAEFLRARGIGWREDQSNLESRFTRNRIRRDLLPQLSSLYNPRISESLAQLAEMAHDEEAWWAEEIAKIAGRVLVPCPTGIEILAGELSAMPRAVARRLVRRAIETVKGDLRGVEFRHVERVLELATKSSGTGGAKLPGVIATRSLDWIRLSTGQAVRVDAVAVEAPGSYPWTPANTNIVLEVAERKGQLCPDRDPAPYATLEVELCWNRVCGPLELRGWRSGDAYWPQGRFRVHEVRELFQDLRIPSWRRSGWPILCNRTTSAIVWAKGFGAARELVADADEGLVLRIFEKPESFAIGSTS